MLQSFVLLESPPQMAFQRARLGKPTASIGIPETFSRLKRFGSLKLSNDFDKCYWRQRDWTEKAPIVDLNDQSDITCRSWEIVLVKQPQKILTQKNGTSYIAAATN